jgi:hypothetical protein
VFVRALEHRIRHVLEAFEVRRGRVALSLGNHGSDIQIRLAAVVTGYQRRINTGEIPDIADGRTLKSACAEQGLSSLEQRLLA